MAHRVRFDQDAEADLNRLYEWIRDYGGGISVAERYVRRITALCYRQRDFPQRGTRRDGIRPGLRTIGFERRATIAFLIDEQEVIILRVLYGGRDLAELARG